MMETGLIRERKRGAHRRLLMILMVGTALSLGALPAVMPVSQAAAQGARMHSFNIPSQPLNRALRALADQSGVQIAYLTAVTSGTTAPAVSGTMTTEEALARLLAGSGLRYSFANSNTVTIVDAASPEGGSVSADGSLVLDTITVEGKGLDGSAAEGYRVAASSVAGFTEQELKDTPRSVKVVSKDLIRNRNMQDVGSLDQMDAAVSNSHSEWYSQQFIRGFALSNSDNYTYNGLPYSNFRDIGLENKERVEVLKGLAGLQAGFASPGGIVNYVTKRPENVTDLHTSVNQHGNAEIHMDVGRLVSEDFGFRINAAMEHQDSYIDHIDGPRHFLSGALSWNITPDTTFDFDIEHERRKKPVQPALGLATDGGLPPMPDSETFLGQDWASFATNATTTEARLEHRLSEDWSVLAQVNGFYMTRTNDWIGFGDIDRATGDVATVMFWGSEDHYKSASARVMAKGSFETGAVKHALAFGYDWAYTYSDWTNAVWYDDIGDTNLFHPVALSRPAAGSGRGESRALRQGPFVHDVLSFGEMWDLHLGGRYALLNQKTDGYEKSVFTPSAAVVFKPRPDLSVYVSYAEGLEQGGIAPTGTSNANQVLNPLVSRQWETGIKGELFGTVNWEASLFHISKAAEYTNSANIYVQDGEQVHKGLELSLSGKITPEWTLYGSAMFMDAKLKETGDPTTTGKRPPGVADVRTTLTAEYAPEALAGWVFAANWTHTGDRPVNAINTAIAPGYDIFGLGLRHEREIGGRDVTFRAGVDNLFDERYWANVDDDFLVQGSPRTIWASMSAKF